MRIASLMMALTFAGATAASAQSIPPITKSKAAAQKAVNATNEHTRRMTASEDSTAASSPRPVTSHATQASAGSTAMPGETAGLSRESFRYQRSGRRDPFVSLMAYGELRPLITELRVTSIAYDPSGGSVAVLRDLGTKEQYRVRVGESLGRMRVARIAKKEITFTIEEFGYSRQETLALVDPKKESSQ
ncbi:MAG TPA: hypothetical protein VFZ73_02745 [Gemmatimonadaceae bacterium]